MATVYKGRHFSMFDQDHRPEAALVQPHVSHDDDEKQRPPNAFILFDRAIREEFMRANPMLPPEEIGRSIGHLWRVQDEERRDVYRRQAHELRAAWHQMHPGESRPGPRRRQHVAKMPEPIRIRVILDETPPLRVPPLDDGHGDAQRF